MNYNKFKNIYVYLYISKNKQKYLCVGAAAGGAGWLNDYIDFFEGREHELLLNAISSLVFSL